MGRFCLRYQSIDVNVGEHDFIAGRVAECDLVLEDPLVSRKHARFRVNGDEVEVADLDSRNGVLINGLRVDKTAMAHHGDRIRIGSQELVLKDVDLAQSAAGTTELTFCRGCGGMLPTSQRVCRNCGRRVDSSIPRTSGDEPVAVMDGGKLQGSFFVLAQLADKALGMGRYEEAERMLANMLSGVLAVAQDAAPPDRDTLRSATGYALRLAEAMQKPAWLDYPFELYNAAAQLMPADLIDELYRVAAKVRYTNPRSIRTYVARIRADAAQLGVSDRFLLQRLEGLERRVVSG